MERIIIWKILSQVPLEVSQVYEKQSSSRHFWFFWNFAQQPLVPKKQLLKRYSILLSHWLQAIKYVSCLYRSWLFCQVSPARTWTLHHTCVFWLPCTPGSENTVHWKILKFRIFTKSHQRLKEGKKAASLTVGGLDFFQNNGISPHFVI